MRNLVNIMKYLVAILLLLVAGCNRTMTAPLNTSDAVITLERTACFGTCPVYSITIYGNGTVIYHGEYSVNVTGTATRQIAPEKVHALVEEFYRANYFSLKDQYSSDLTDMPSQVTSITIAGLSKRVENYVSGPRVLFQLEDKIDEVASSDDWIKGPSHNRTAT
jgi:hypothetical protein